MAANGFGVFLMGELVEQGEARLGFRILVADRTDVERLALKAEEAGPHGDRAAWWVAEQDWNAVEKEGLELWEVIEYPLRRLELALDESLGARLRPRWLRAHGPAAPRLPRRRLGAKREPS